ncbi:molybdenum cofactor synthesis domain-containing protein [Hyaloraphidium curvatum]|nr:molybdenum cofactor synthesis domain-containing protein [Hyaloraphidium curvatum]
MQAPRLARLAQLTSHLSRPASRSAYKKRPLDMNPAAGGGKDPRTVACLIIGDEVLGGKTQDTNSHYLAKKCFDVGLDLRRIEVVPDIQEDIIERVRYLSERFAWVFTSGGIGPTHDDITYEALANAFPGHHLEYHEPTISRMQKWLEERNATLDPGVPKMEMTTARKRMALLPTGGPPGLEAQHIVPDPALWVPVVVVNGNVAVLPGVPRLFRGLLDAFVDKVIMPKLPAAEAWERGLVATSMFEADIADALTDIAARSEPDGIKIGSYPKSPPRGPDGQPIDPAAWKIKVVVSVVGKDAARVNHWVEVVKGKVDGWTVTLEETQKLE